MDRFTAWYFDGRTAAATRAILARGGSDLVLLRADGSLLQRTPLASVMVTERFEHGPLLLSLPHAATLEVDQAHVAQRLEQLLGHHPSLAARLQQSWRGALLAVALVVAALVAFYFRGLPWVADQAASAMPAGLEQRMGEEVLRVLDKRFLAPSKDYDADRTQKAELARRFDEFAARSALGVHYRVEFRSVRGGDGVNAFTLPGGIIVVLDGLIGATESEEQVLAVMAHELGHVAFRHSIKRATKALGLGVLAGLLWGDVSSLAANVPAVIGVLSYSREEEREADAFAAKVLADNGLGAEPLIEVFEMFAHKHEKCGCGLPEFLSSHPSTSERIETLRNTLPARP